MAKNLKQGSRDNESKTSLSFVFDAPNAVSGLAQRFEYGCKKYKRNNWRKGLPWIELLDSFDRHRVAFQNGEDIDKESGQPHVWAMLWNAFILAEIYHTRKDLDDRVLPSQVPLIPIDIDE